MLIFRWDHRVSVATSVHLPSRHCRKPESVKSESKNISNSIMIRVIFCGYCVMDVWCGEWCGWGSLLPLCCWKGKWKGSGVTIGVNLKILWLGVVWYVVWWKVWLGFMSTTVMLERWGVGGWSHNRGHTLRMWWLGMVWCVVWWIM